MTVSVVVCLPCRSRDYWVHLTCHHTLVLYISLCQHSIFYFIFVLSSFHLLLHFSLVIIPSSMSPFSCHHSIFYVTFCCHHSIFYVTFLLSSFHLLLHYSCHHFSLYFATLCHHFTMLITSPQHSLFQR